MSDLDYLMSRLARKLAASGLFAVQVDPRGHGDSSGSLSEVDLDSLREDINAVADHYCRLYPDLLVFIGRGLSATLIAEQLGARAGIAIVAISQYEMSPEVMKQRITDDRITCESAVDAVALFPGKDYVRLGDFAAESIAIIDALGTVPYHLHGTMVSGNLVRQLTQFDAAAALRNGRDSGRLFLEETFVRDAAWQAKLVERVAHSVEQRCAAGS
jgi:hypothetical protein